MADWMEEDGVTPKVVEQAIIKLEKEGHLRVNWHRSRPERLRIQCVDPLHADDNASCDLSTDKGLFYCHGCGTKGNVYTLWARATHCHIMDARRAIQVLCCQQGPSLSKPSASGHTLLRKKADRYLMDIPFSVINQYHANLITEARLFNTLYEETGLGREVAHRFKVGWHPKSKRFSIPIVDQHGKVRNIRLYRQGKDPKCLHWREMCPDGKTVDTSTLLGEYKVTKTKPQQILICEGEMDCLRVWQEGYAGLTVTGGVQQWRHLKEKVRALGPDAHLDICVDWDPVGDKMALMLRDWYWNDGASVSRCEYPECTPGKDIRDILDNNGSIEDIITRGRQDAALDNGGSLREVLHGDE